MIKAVIFDLGGTLRYQPSVEEVREQLLLSLKVHNIDTSVADEFGKRLTFLLNCRERLDISNDILAINILNNIFREFGINGCAREVAEYVARSLCKISTFPQASTKVIDNLINNGYKIALLSNTIWPSYIYKEELAIYLKYFTSIKFSDETLIRKPNKKAFIDVCEELNHEYKNIMMVGDSIDNDIIPAKELGMKTVLIGQNYSAEPNHNIKEILEILDVLEVYNE